jgi:membrane fusion protein (multidrug efflux system)
MTESTSPQPPSQRARWVFLGAGGGLLLLTLLLFATADRPGAESAVGAEATATTIDVLVIEERALERSTRLSAVVEARRRIQLVAETQGRVLEVGADELDRVTADQMLVQVDPLLAEVAVERAAAAVARSQSQLALARDERARFENLATRDVASASRRDQAQNAERVAAANLRDAKASLQEARDARGKKTIRAPFAGVLQGFHVEVGEVLRAGDPLGELLDLGAARLELGVTDREIVDLVPGETVEVTLEAYPGETFEGELLRVGAAADQLTKKFPVEVEIPNPEGRILPGMVARATLHLAAEPNVRRIPRDAALDQFGIRYVWLVVDGDNGPETRRRRVEVRDISFQPGEIEVVSGLENGDVIAVGGIRELREGARVRPRTPALAGAAAEEAGS